MPTPPIHIGFGEFEKRYGRLVYHAVLEEMSLGNALYLLFVSSHDEGFEEAMYDLVAGTPLVYGVNLEDLDYSELGCMPIAVDGGILINVQ